MDPVERRLVELLAIAETPLYSAYIWLNRQLGCALPLEAFLRFMNSLVRRGLVHLWVVDSVTGERAELPKSRTDLAYRYSTVRALDPAYDPFGLSLTVSAAARPMAGVDEPEWTLDVDWEAGTFTVSGDVECAMARLSQLFTDHEFAANTHGVRSASGTIRRRNAGT
ncbi:MAG: hypothetical protein WBD02_11290 [Acidimicrobiia bacterium]